jgi:hypothetical protein
MGGSCLPIASSATLGHAHVPTPEDRRRRSRPSIYPPVVWGELPACPSINPQPPPRLGYQPGRLWLGVPIPAIYLSTQFAMHRRGYRPVTRRLATLANYLSTQFGMPVVYLSAGQAAARDAARGAPTAHALFQVLRKPSQ